MFALSQCVLDAGPNPVLPGPLDPWKVTITVDFRGLTPKPVMVLDSQYGTYYLVDCLEELHPIAVITAQVLAVNLPAFGGLPLVSFSFCFHTAHVFWSDSFRFMSSPG